MLSLLGNETEVPVRTTVTRGRELLVDLIDDGGRGCIRGRRRSRERMGHDDGVRGRQSFGVRDEYIDGASVHEAVIPPRVKTTKTSRPSMGGAYHPLMDSTVPASVVADHASSCGPAFFT
jgi:hypothetical protein